MNYAEEAVWIQVENIIVEHALMRDPDLNFVELKAAISIVAEALKVPNWRLNSLLEEIDNFN